MSAGGVLYLDLEGTLLPGDLAWERRIAGWRGSPVAVDLLPYQAEAVEAAKRAREAKRDVILVSGADPVLTKSIADHLGVFTGVLPTNGRPSADVVKAHAAGRAFEQPAFTARPLLPALLKALRPHQWVKNLLVFLPLIMAHRIGDVNAWLASLAAFACLSLAASSVYTTNDIFDLEADRRHPSKKRRPMASGALPLSVGFVLGPLLFFMALALSWALLPSLFLVCLLLYVFISTTYSLRWKRHMSLDVIVLAGLYTFRVIAGGVATSIEVSEWLLSFSMFFFLCLAQLKRYTELQRLKAAGQDPFNSRRGYHAGDMEILRSAGPASGYLSVLVLVLYVNSTRVVELYNNPKVLWLIAPLLLYWVTRIWILAHRMVLDDDPIVFTVKDRISYLAGLVVMLIVLVASL